MIIKLFLIIGCIRGIIFISLFIFIDIYFMGFEENFILVVVKVVIIKSIGYYYSYFIRWNRYNGKVFVDGDRFIFIYYIDRYCIYGVVFIGICCCILNSMNFGRYIGMWF